MFIGNNAIWQYSRYLLELVADVNCQLPADAAHFQISYSKATLKERSCVYVHRQQSYLAI